MASWLHAEHVRLLGGVASRLGGNLSAEAGCVLGTASVSGTQARGSEVDILQGWREGCSSLQIPALQPAPAQGPPGGLGGWGTQGVQAFCAGPCPGPQPFTPRLSSVLSCVRPPSSGCGRRSWAEPGGGVTLGFLDPTPLTLLLGTHLPVSPQPAGTEFPQNPPGSKEGSRLSDPN